jgi:hypothetical protein
VIAKRVPRKVGHSSYQHLADYILDTKHNGMKVVHAWTTNLSVPNDFQIGIAETMATQQLNSRSKIDKTYHLVVSLGIGESLTEEQFKHVEERVCSVIGFSEHQRICAIHNDTNIVHMHLAISKVHPLTLNTIEPYYDKLKLMEVCRELEQIYGLQAGISPEKQARGIGTSPAEAHQGLESFGSWVKTHFREPLLNLMNKPESSWREIQELAGKYGVEIRERGAGLVIAHVSEKLFVKASSIDRSFSKKVLEERFGPLERSPQKVHPELQYIQWPIGGSPKSKALYTAYLTEMGEIRARRRDFMMNQIGHRSKSVEEIKARYVKRRQEVKLDPIIAKSRKVSIYRDLSVEMKKELDECFKVSREQRAEVGAALTTKPWRDWLVDKAEGGDELALEVLRQKPKARVVKDDICFIEGESKGHPIFSGMKRKVHKDGTVEYGSGSDIFLDQGNVILVRSANESILKTALLAARSKFGESYKISGSKEILSLFERIRKAPDIVGGKELTRGRDRDGVVP